MRGASQARSAAAVRSRTAARASLAPLRSGLDDVSWCERGTGQHQQIDAAQRTLRTIDSTKKSTLTTTTSNKMTKSNAPTST